MRSNTRVPTRSQANILTALRDAETTFYIRDGGIAPGLATKMQVTILIQQGWAESVDGVLRITQKGDQMISPA